MRRPSKIRAAPDEQRRFFLETVSLLPLQVILCYIISQHHLSCLPLSIPFISTSYLSAVSGSFFFPSPFPRFLLLLLLLLVIDVWFLVTSFCRLSRPFVFILILIAEISAFACHCCDFWWYRVILIRISDFCCFVLLLIVVVIFQDIVHRLSGF